MFCKQCGNEIQENWTVCPNCGCKISEEKKKEDVNYESKEYNLIGTRRTGRASFWRVPSAIKIEGENVHIVTQGKKTIENHFKKTDISGIDFPILPIWRISDYLRLVVFGICMIFTKGLSIFAVLYSIKIAVSRHLRIKLSTGQVIKIPICQKADASEFLRELNYPEEEIAKNESKKVTYRKWALKEWMITILLGVVAGFSMYLGFQMELESRQQKVSTSYSENNESYSDVGQEEDELKQKDKDIPEGAELESYVRKVEPGETVDDDINDLAMYLVNGNGKLPVQVENVYLSSDYSGFTTVSFNMVNISNVDIKEATFGIVAWDSNMLPLELTRMYEFDSTYFYRGNGNNIAVGQTAEASIAFEEKDIKYMQILLLEYSDFEGNVWTNPAASYYETNFAGKKFDENTMTAMIFEEVE